MSLRMKYFVLKPESKCYGDRFAEASRRAMIEFARAIHDYDPDLATDIMDWVKRTTDEADQMLGRTPTSEQVRLTYQRYNQLMKAEAQLNALYEAGVDNWDGYEEAARILQEGL